MRIAKHLVTLASAVVALLAMTSSANAQWWSYWLRRQVPPTAATVDAPTNSPTVVPTRTPTSAPTRTPTRTSLPTATFTPISGGETVQSSGPPAQKLPAALVVFPLVQAQTTTQGVTQDTRIELVNLSGSAISLNCFYLRSQGWVELGFFITLTANQPLSWLASTGTSNPATFSSVPPFTGEGELKCGVIANSPSLSDYNVLQGRAIVFDDTGQAASYSAVAFRRLSSGDYDGVFNLDGQTYEKCPDKLHFDVLAVQSGSTSEIVLTPCNQDFVNQVPTTVTAQFLIINEFEQSFSASISIVCWDRRALNKVTSTLSYSTLGTNTAHMIVRGTQSSLIGLVLDKFSSFGKPVTTGNEPFLEGGRSGTVLFP